MKNKNGSSHSLQSVEQLCAKINNKTVFLKIKENKYWLLNFYFLLPYPTADPNDT